jgi:hypothetical protein
VSSVLWRAVALGPGGIGDSQRYASNRRFFDETSTPWVRLWADWPVLEPERGAAPDFTRLDQDVEAARADGRRIILTAWRFPRWANGTEALTAAADAAYQLDDRIDPGDDPARRKDLTFKLPGDLSFGSDWARWIDSLLARYGGSIDALELTNEPNLQLWPQTGVADAVARMMATAQTVAGSHLTRPLLLAPATSDAVGDSRLRTSYDTFTRMLLDRLDANGFTADASFAWSHHSYADVEGDLAGPDSRTARVHALLTDRWPGWPAGTAADPGLLVTETGARLDRIAALYGLSDPAAVAQRQAELIERYWRRMQFDPEGVGVGMVCLYLFVTDMHYDSGLCDLDGSPRPAYHAWASLPAFD